MTRFFKRAGRIVTLPVDRAYLLIQFLLKFYASIAEPQGHRPPEEVDAGGRRFAVLGSGPRRHWPTIRVPIPRDSEYRFTATAIFLRTAFWHTFTPLDQTLAFLRASFEAQGIPFEEKRKAGHVRFRPRFQSEAEIRVTQPDSSRVIIAVRQYW